MEGVFNEQRLRLLELIASQIAVALENARLYTQLSNQKEQIENLLNLTKEMSKSDSKVAAGIIALSLKQGIKRQMLSKAACQLV